MISKSALHTPASAPADPETVPPGRVCRRPAPRCSGGSLGTGAAAATAAAAPRSTGNTPPTHPAPLCRLLVGPTLTRDHAVLHPPPPPTPPNPRLGWWLGGRHHSSRLPSSLGRRAVGRHSAPAGCLCMHASVCARMPPSLGCSGAQYFDPPPFFPCLPLPVNISTKIGVSILRHPIGYLVKSAILKNISNFKSSHHISHMLRYLKIGLV